MWEQKGNFLDGTVLIGDTVATGTTLCGVLEFIAGEMDKASKWNDIFVFAIAGATKGEPMFQKVHNKLAAHGKALTIVYAAPSCSPLPQFSLTPQLRHLTRVQHAACTAATPMLNSISLIMAPTLASLAPPTTPRARS